MGLEIVVPRSRPCSLARLVETLSAAGLRCTVVMVDNVLQGPGAAPPPEWRDARLKTPGGIVTLRRGSSGVAVVVFGNADADLQAAQRRVAEAVRATP